MREKNLDDDAFAGVLAMLDETLKSGSFDQVRSALVTCTKLYDRYYANESRRAEIEERTANANRSVPLDIHISTLLDMAEYAIGHRDQPKGLELVDKARSVIDGMTWAAEDKVKVEARLAKVRFLSGDERRARTEADNALGLFDKERTTIFDIYRAGALRPLAAARHAMGDHEHARQLYLRVIDEGNVNPNSRPRADDLAATCLSMIRNNYEPTPEMWEKLRKSNEALGYPW